jgi:hypothetical protein
VAHHINWGDVPTWLAVVGAFIGTGVALRQLRGQQKDIARQTKQLERQQADKVEVLTVREQPQLVHVINNSLRPIRDITACIDLGSGKDRCFATQVELWGTTPETTNFGPTLPREHLDAPSVEFIRPAVRATFTFALPPPIQRPGDHRWVYFTDDADLRWQIGPGLRLQPLSAEQQAKLASWLAAIPVPAPPPPPE